ncbi:DinB family protein [Hugenholtzia roseola]|uniref:DinB family protein n=1 Tax=Hugenholtzia roseola TaxID=1002 RepID=UPI00042489DD|nr:DinB family protein [Hugenholtzia roseola]
MTQSFHRIWVEARTRFSNQLVHLNATDLTKKLEPAPNSVGFLIRHIADVELLFAKNVFRLPDVKVSAKTVIEKSDTGEWTDLQSLLDYQQYAFEKLEKAILSQSQADWQAQITTQEFGTKTKAEAFARILSHTAYHAGQMAIILKYGASKS